MQSQIILLEDANQRLEKKLEDLEQSAPSKPPGTLLHGREVSMSEGSEEVVSEESLGSLGNLLAFPPLLIETQTPTYSRPLVTVSEKKVSFEEVTPKKKIGKQNTMDRGESIPEEISMPTMVAKIRKRWFESEAAAGVDVSALSKVCSSPPSFSSSFFASDINLLLFLRLVTKGRI